MTPSTEQRINEEAEAKYPLVKVPDSWANPMSAATAEGDNMTRRGQRDGFIAGAKRGYEIAMEEIKKLLENAYQGGAIDSACDEANYNLWYDTNYKKLFP